MAANESSDYPRPDESLVYCATDPAVRSEYEAILAALRRQFPSALPYLGTINPYNREPIRSEEEFELYLQQRALSLAYSRIYVEHEQKANDRIAELQSELSRTERLRREELSRHDADANAALRKQKRRSRFSLLAIVLVFASVLLINHSTRKEAAPAVVVSTPEVRTVYVTPDPAPSSKSLPTPAGASAPTATPAPAPSYAPSRSVPDESEIVYVTNTGKKYHRDGCGYLSQSKIAISLDDAKARGYTPCSRCW